MMLPSSLTLTRDVGRGWICIGAKQGSTGFRPTQSQAGDGRWPRQKPTAPTCRKRHENGRLTSAKYAPRHLLVEVILRQQVRFVLPSLKAEVKKYGAGCAVVLFRDNGSPRIILNYACRDWLDSISDAGSIPASSKISVGAESRRNRASNCR